MLGSAQLAHASAEARFKCYLFRKSAMSQRLILRGLHSAALSHAEIEEAADTYKASFAAAPKDQQVCRYSPWILRTLSAAVHLPARLPVSAVMAGTCWLLLAQPPWVCMLHFEA